MNAPFPNPPSPSTRQPILNLPPVVTAMVAVLIGIQAARGFLSPDTDLQIILDFAFFPVRETSPDVFAGVAPAGAVVWSFLSYAFLHADWAHVLMNVVWLAAFGSPLARRFGAGRFVLFSAVGAVAGAALHLAIFPSSAVPVVGASAAISAQMAGAARFVFQPGGPMWARGQAASHFLPAAPLGQVLRDRRVLTFLAIWFGINLLFGLIGGAAIGEGAIAWAAHIGGFLAGLLLFPLFDPVRAPSIR